MKDLHEPDAILDRDGRVIVQSTAEQPHASGREAPFGPQVRVFNLSSSGLPLFGKIALGLLIPAVLFFGFWIIVAFVVGLLVLRIVGGILGRIGFRAGPVR
jgi:hypothetical protein